MADNNGIGNGSNGNGSINGYSVRWQWFMSITTAIAIAMGALLTFFVQSASLSTTVSIDSARIVALEVELQQVNERATVTRTQVTGMRSDLRQVETELCSSDTVRNLMHAYDLRFMSMVWRHVNPELPLPTDNSYYPAVCKDGAARTTE